MMTVGVVIVAVAWFTARDIVAAAAGAAARAITITASVIATRGSNALYRSISFAVVTKFCFHSRFAAVSHAKIRVRINGAVTVSSVGGA